MTIVPDVRKYANKPIPMWINQATGMFAYDYMLWLIFDNVHESKYIKRIITCMCFYVHKPRVDLACVHSALLGAVW